MAQSLQLWAVREGPACYCTCVKDRTSEQERVKKEGAALSIQPHIAQVLPGAECARLEAVTDCGLVLFHERLVCRSIPQCLSLPHGTQLALQSKRVHSHHVPAHHLASHRLPISPKFPCRFRQRKVSCG